MSSMSEIKEELCCVVSILLGEDTTFEAHLWTPNEFLRGQSNSAKEIINHIKRELQKTDARYALQIQKEVIEEGYWSEFFPLRAVIDQHNSRYLIN